MSLELRDKLKEFAPSAPGRAASPVEEDVLSALVNLGYPRPAAERALATVANGGDRREFDLLFRQALASLSK
jgi:Holliday junction DNA helicase RuvA